MVGDPKISASKSPGALTTPDGSNKATLLTIVIIAINNDNNNSWRVRVVQIV